MLLDLVITGYVGGFPERKEAWIGSGRAVVAVRK
jgi:hypothetical protein